MLTLVTTKAIPPEYNPVDVDIGVSEGMAKLAVVEGVPVLKVPPGSKSWCSGAVTRAWVRQFIYRVPQGTTLINYDHAPGMFFFIKFYFLNIFYASRS